MDDVRELVAPLIENVEQVIVGKRSAIEFIMVALLCEGHILLEDVPGSGKTMLARAIAFKRIQLLFALLVWYFPGHFLDLLDEIGLDQAMVLQESPVLVQGDTIPARNRLVNLFFSVGIALVILTTVARLNLVRLLSLQTSWTLQRIPVLSEDLTRQWVVYSLVFLLILAVVVSQLPAGDSLGFFPVVRNLLGLRKAHPATPRFPKPPVVGPVPTDFLLLFCHATPRWRTGFGPQACANAFRICPSTGKSPAYSR